MYNKGEKMDDYTQGFNAGCLLKSKAELERNENKLFNLEERLKATTRADAFGDGVRDTLETEIACLKIWVDIQKEYIEEKESDV